MTRKEEIQKEATVYSDNPANFCAWIDTPMTTAKEMDDKEYVEDAFIAGAKWADKSMIEKVCNWLERNCMGFILTEDEISDFRKAMED